jgi:hypothetical protein
MLAGQVAGGGSVVTSAIPDDCLDEQIYRLPHDGNFRVIYDPKGHKNNLRFSMVEKGDPLVNVGLESAQISINFGAFGPAKSTATAYDRVCGVGESWPASIAIDNQKIWFQLAKVQGYEKVFPDEKNMRLLISSLHIPGRSIDAKKLPYANSGDAATVMTVRPTLIKEAGWKAWRWIEGNSQDGDYPSGLSFVVEGITNDGKFFFRMTSTIDHPEQKRLSTDTAEYEAVRDKADTQNRLLLEKALATADPASFTPNLNDLDSVIRSLKLKP